MRRILGLDLGSASIGWAVIDESSDKTKIVALGSRIIPYDGTEGQDFTKGKGESRNAARTAARTIRKGYDRYQLRRKNLVDVLVENGMMPDETLQTLPKEQLWALRDKAVSEHISKQELGRILLWLNQKRGYKSARSDSNLDKKDTEYVAQVKSRHEMIKEQNLTIGQYFYKELCNNEYFRVKENIFPREAYIEEFDKICEQQKEHLGLTDELISKIRNEIIYYQRPLKSQKGLVATCEFEGTWITKDGKEYFIGPKVAPKSSPLFQVAKIWETINNLKLKGNDNEEQHLSMEEKLRLFEYLDNHERITSTQLFKILQKDKKEYSNSKQLDKDLSGNIVKASIAKILGENYKELLRFDLSTITTDRFIKPLAPKSKETLEEKPLMFIDPKIEKEPFYQLWHTIYSINDMEECSNALQKGIIVSEKTGEEGEERKVRIAIDKGTADKLAALDFSRLRFGNKSAKAIRKILPYLMEGNKYSEAMSYAGYNHSNSLTKAQNLERELLDKLKPVEKNSLRQPIVEKILNQMINVVNSVIEKHGKPKEIRVELARELKQSKDERNKAHLKGEERQRKNASIAKRLEEYGLRATRNNIIKWRLYEELCSEDDKLNATCVYCGQPISLAAAICGKEVEVEHIIPKAKLFDDSQSNKTLAHRRCNSDKDDWTAYDFMKEKHNGELEAYVERVNRLYANDPVKRKKLLMSAEQIPQDFISRQLRESQYIARKACEILQTICHVQVTSGTVTAELRRLWGWEDITMNLQMHKYKAVNQTEIVTWESQHGKRKHSKEVIKDWSKRDDQRHHAIDALTIACTKPGFIQRLNTLNARKTKDEMEDEVAKHSAEYKEKLSLLEKYLVSQRPLSTKEVEEAVSKILISFKAGKKVAVWGKRKVGKRGEKRVVQERIIVPRGALNEDSVYGRIRIIEKEKPLLYLFNNPHLIFRPNVKALVEERLKAYNNNARKAVNSLKEDPIYLDNDKTKVLEYATCIKEEFVKKITVDTQFSKVNNVVDGNIKNILLERLSKFKGNPKEAFKDVQKEGKTLKWYEDEGLERPIHSVRCLTGLSAVVPVRRDENGREIGFVKPGNNHHVAIYTDKDGKPEEHICTFWHAVERKKYGIPVIIKNTNELWDKIWQQPENTYPQNFLGLLPPPNLEIKFSMQQNEMFTLEIPQEEVKEAIRNKDYKKISDHLYRVNNISASDYFFYHHLETKKDIKNENARISKRYFRFKSINTLLSLQPVKVRIDYLGGITEIKE